MRQNEIQIFSTSFLDLLSCGMAAVIVLCFVFAAQSSGEGEMEGDGVVVSIKSDAALALRLHSATNSRLVGIGSPATSPALITPWAHGANEYKLVIDEARLSPQDTIDVFWCEYLPSIKDSSAETEVTISTYTSAAPTTKRLKLSRASPAHQGLILADIVK